MIALNNLRSQNKSITSLSKLHVYCIHGFGLHTENASFVSLDDLDNISIFLEEDNDLEEEIVHLFNERSLFIFKFEKKHDQSGSRCIQNMNRNMG